MTNFEMIKEAFGALEGLDVSVKIGKESEIIIKGDLIKMMTILAKLADKDARDANIKYEIAKLENELANG